MPLRQMQYAGNLYEQYLKKQGLNKYGSMLLKLPVPKLVVFYNGEDNRPDETILRLSDSFPENVDADIEVRVRMLNINHGRNAALLKACQPLREYSWFIAQIRQNMAMTISDDSTANLTYAVNQAIQDAPDSFLIKQFLLIHQSEVLGMLLTEYDEVETMKMFEKDGRNKERKELLLSLVKDKLLSIPEAAKRLNVSEFEFKKLMSEQ